MIAPIQRTEPTPQTPAMHRARRLVASQLLPENADAPDASPPIPRWRAWLFTGWIVTVVVIYLAVMAALI